MQSQHRQAIGKALKGNEGLFDEGPKRITDAGDSNMRNDFTACDGPQLATAAPSGRSRRRRTLRRGLLALPLALALIVGSTTVALAAESTSGYAKPVPAPKTTPATTPSPKGEAAPTNTSTAPSKAEAPASSTEPTATTAAKATTLPFTGLDLRWVILAGVLLVGMGMSIVVVQRGRDGSANR
jgi:hypothetical protein